MVILDQRLYMSDAQDVSGAPGATLSTQVIDQREAGDAAHELYVEIQVDTSFDLVATGTFGIELVTADDAALTTNDETLWAWGPTAVEADLAAGHLARFRLPQGTRRFIGMRYTRATETTTTGVISARMMRNPQTARQF